MTKAEIEERLRQLIRNYNEEADYCTKEARFCDGDEKYIWLETRSAYRSVVRDLERLI